MVGCSDGTRVIPDAPADDIVTAYTMTTSKGVITLETHRSWAPNGVDRFAELVAANFYNDTRFFRVVSGFVVQFGINGTPATDAMWSNRTIDDDPVAQSNVRGYVTYAATAAANSRTTQLFFNLVDNSFLDDMHFAPFAVVTSGLDVVDMINAEYGERPDQDKISSDGNAYLMASFPNLDYIETVTTP
jgi:cyclophilin family peptidyl-prolyl cis-trans isomerase